MDTATTKEPPTALSRELSEFLIELSIGVHRYAMYPPEHPSLEPVTENIVGRLADLFESRRTLSIGVADRQLVIDDVATDPGHPVLSDLARRLHEHQVGALTFELGVTASEVSGLLGALAADTGEEGLPLGLRPANELPTWEHAGIRPIGYDALEIRRGGDGGAGAARANELWLGLARAAAGLEELEGAVPAGGDLARAIGDRGGAAAYDEVIAGYLRQIATALKAGGGEEAEAVRARVAALLERLDDDTLTRLVGVGAGSAEGRRFLLDANQSLAVDSVMRLLEAAARGSDHSISRSMTRLLSKLAMHAQGEAGPVKSQADTALRENVERLLAGWDGADPTPGPYAGLLDAMARAAPMAGAPSEEEDELTGPERVLRTALEVDVWGPTVGRALDRVLEAGEGTGPVLALAEAAPEGNRAAERILAHITGTATFKALLGADRMDAASLRTLVARMGEEAIDPLLDVLADSDSRAVRRKVFDALAGLGASVGHRAVARMEDGRWFVVRNMLALLLRLEEIPQGFDPQPFLEHADIRVRREALPLAMRLPERRERALATALSDEDERMVRMGLLALEKSGSVSKAVLPTLLNRVVLAEARSGAIRSQAVRCLSGSASNLVHKALLELAVAGKSLLGKLRLAEGPEALAALGVLATNWAEDPEVELVLDEARRSKDPAVRAAVAEGQDEDDR